MNFRLTTVLALCAASFASMAVSAADRVRLVEGGSITGSVVESSPRGVTIEANGQQKQVPITAIKAILFDSETPQLTQARINFASEGYETALEKLSEVPNRAIERDVVRQEIAFYQAMSEARLAIAGSRDAKKAAGKLAGFVKSNRDSFHFYEAVETLGLLATSLGSHNRAEQMYGMVAKAPYAPLKVRGRVLAAEALQQQGKHSEAIEFFESALAIDSDSTERDAAALGKAASLAATGQLDDGLELVRSVLLDAEEADEALRAAAYNALGRCYEAAERPKDALFAYLHTDLLFSSDPTTHAEALGRLVELWKKAGKPEAAQDALRRLRQRYAASPAARRTG